MFTTVGFPVKPVSDKARSLLKLTFFILSAVMLPAKHIGDRWAIRVKSTPLIFKVRHYPTSALGQKQTFCDYPQNVRFRGDFVAKLFSGRRNVIIESKSLMKRLILA